MSNDEQNIDTVVNALPQPRMSGQPMTLKMLFMPVHLRYGYESVEEMASARYGMSAEWRLVEEMELNNRLLECQIKMLAHMIK